jgi:hypothetical protein
MIKIGEDFRLRDGFDHYANAIPLNVYDLRTGTKGYFLNKKEFVAFGGGFFIYNKVYDYGLYIYTKYDAYQNNEKVFGGCKDLPVIMSDYLLSPEKLNEEWEKYKKNIKKKLIWL